jgi:hypothetical protein
VASTAAGDDRILLAQVPYPLQSSPESKLQLHSPLHSPCRRQTTKPPHRLVIVYLFFRVVLCYRLLNYKTREKCHHLLRFHTLQLMVLAGSSPSCQKIQTSQRKDSTYNKS